jgi:hypothetical protein
MRDDPAYPKEYLVLHSMWAVAGLLEIRTSRADQDPHFSRGHRSALPSTEHSFANITSSSPDHHLPRSARGHYLRPSAPTCIPSQHAYTLSLVELGFPSDIFAMRMTGHSAFPTITRSC